MRTGADRATCCHPDRLSRAGVAVASRCPLPDHTVTRCAPRSPLTLRKRTAVSAPALPEVNRRPSSTGRVSESAVTPDTSSAAKNE